MTKYGFELEVPLCSDDKDPFAAKGESGHDIVSELDDALPMGMEATHERIGKSEYGTEIRTTDPLGPRRVMMLYSRTIVAIEHVDGVSFTPTGAFGDTTAGLHIHFSGVEGDDKEIAVSLAEDSDRPLLKAACCTTVFLDKERDEVVAPVCRADADRRFASTNYCEMKYGSFKHSVVNPRENGHYEWRLAEPMTSQNFAIVMQFLARYLDERAGIAFDYLSRQFNSSPRRFTSIQRARKLREQGYEIPEETEAAALIAHK